MEVWKCVHTFFLTANNLPPKNSNICTFKIPEIEFSKLFQKFSSFNSYWTYLLKCESITHFISTQQLTKQMKMKNAYLISPTKKCIYFYIYISGISFSTRAGIKSHFKIPGLESDFFSHCYKILNDFWGSIVQQIMKLLWKIKWFIFNKFTNTF